jgi:hypothetical protein
MQVQPPRPQETKRRRQVLTQPVPDYFQEESEDALRSRVRWLETEVGLGSPFFARLLRTEEKTFSAWRERRGALSREDLLGLRELWDTILHLLSFVNFDCERARQLLEFIPAATSRGEGESKMPPWAGSSIKAYLETHGSGAVDDVNRWVTSFRFGTPSLTPEHPVPCPSTQD